MAAYDYLALAKFRLISQYSYRSEFSKTDPEKNDG
ncbi:hypothetical protein HNQ57_003024 [Zhongshania antarctica]|uniref:Uncharacterized protein n=1 Tax=Zhongshania antarctica TaxID=641702 RepID=A0A840R8F3_9GAMM|nr:hypothetical protein [Zhongshania antarctica]